MSMMGGQPPGQGTAGITDLVNLLHGILTQLTNWVSAFNERLVYGTFTLGAAATTEVLQPAAQANSQISFTALNASAGTLMGSTESLYLSSINPGVSFTVATASGSNAAGTEQFQYKITTPS